MNLIYRTAHSEELPLLVELQSAVFLHDEPMTKALGLTEEAYKEYLSLILPLSIKRKMTYVAIDVDTNALAGMLVNFPQTLSQEEVPQFSDRIIASVMDTNMVFDMLEEPLAQYKAWRDETCVRNMFVSVSKDYLRMGIATGLLRFSEESCKQRGIKMLVADATNIKSEKTFLRCGFKEIQRVKFSTNTATCFRELEGDCILLIKELGG